MRMMPITKIVIALLVTALGLCLRGVNGGGGGGEGVLMVNNRFNESYAPVYNASSGAREHAQARAPPRGDVTRNSPFFLVLNPI